MALACNFERMEGSSSFGGSLSVTLRVSSAALEIPAAWSKKLSPKRSRGQDTSFLHVLSGMPDWQSSKLQAPSSRKIPNSKAQSRRGKRVPPPWVLLAASQVLRGSFWCLGFGAFLELGTWSLELPA